LILTKKKYSVSYNAAEVQRTVSLRGDFKILRLLFVVEVVKA